VARQRRLVVPVITLLFGIAIAAGVFLPWACVNWAWVSVDVQTGVVTISGWDLAQFGGACWQSQPVVYIVLLGGILIVVHGIRKLGASRASRAIQRILPSYVNTAYLGSILALVGSIWCGSILYTTCYTGYLSPYSDPYLGYGFYISSVFSGLMLVSEIALLVKTFRAKKASFTLSPDELGSKQR
jgi:hypothetical protein